MRQEITDGCGLFFAATGLPVLCFDQQGDLAFWFPLWLNKTSPDISGLKFDENRNPDVYITKSQGFYGQILLEDGSRVVIGPAYSEDIDDSIIHDYIKENKIPAGRWDLAYATLTQGDRMSYQRFLRMIAFLYHDLERKTISIAEHFNFPDQERQYAMDVENARKTMEMKETRAVHNTYEFEQKFYEQVRAGDEKKLLDFMVQYTPQNFNRGHLADNTLRNAKNQVIVGIVKILVLAALPGKMDMETAYTLTDEYILAAENTKNLAELQRLEYVLTMDFCRRIGESNVPAGTSQEIYECMNYIQDHTNEPLSVADVAKHMGRSLSYLHVHFRNETGKSVREYIMSCKLNEAARLLKFSDRSLAEISNYLCFSSQSYFQNTFKKEFGVTPAQFRRENKK